MATWKCDNVVTRWCILNTYSGAFIWHNEWVKKEKLTQPTLPHLSSYPVMVHSGFKGWLRLQAPHTSKRQLLSSSKTLIQGVERRGYSQQGRWPKKLNNTNFVMKTQLGGSKVGIKWPFMSRTTCKNFKETFFLTSCSDVQFNLKTTLLGLKWKEVVFDNVNRLTARNSWHGKMSYKLISHLFYKHANAILVLSCHLARWQPSFLSTAFAHYYIDPQTTIITPYKAIFNVQWVIK